MATTFPNYALISASVDESFAAASRVKPPVGWRDVSPISQVNQTSGIKGTAYLNGNELVIVYAGVPGLNSSWTTGALPASLATPGITLLEEAAKFYLDTVAAVSASGANPSVSFTGNGLGGGISSLLAVYFNKPATVFDEAPFADTAKSPTALAALKSFLSTQYGTSVPQALADYSLTEVSGPNSYLGRAQKVLDIYIAGSMMSTGAPGAASKIRGGSYALEIATAGSNGWAPSSSDLSGMELIASLASSYYFDQGMSASPELVSRFLNGALSRKNNLAGGTSGALEKVLLEAHVASTSVKARSYYSTFGVLNVIGEDFRILGESERFKRSANGTKQAVAGLADYVLNNYYVQIVAKSNLLANPLSWDSYNSNVSVTLAGSSWDTSFTRESFRQMLHSYYPSAAGEEALKADRWSFQVGTAAVNSSAFTWSALADNLSDVVLGGATADSIDTGAGDDVLAGGQGNDTLMGGLGNDVYLYAKGEGFDTLLDKGGVDRLILKGVSSSNLVSSRKDNGLVLSFGGEQLFIQNFFSSADFRIESFVLDDRTFTADELLALPSNTPAGVTSLPFTGVTQRSFNIQNERTAPQYYAYGAGFATGPYSDYVQYYSSQGFTFDAQSSTVGVSLVSYFGADYVIGSAFSDTVLNWGGSDHVTTGAGNDSVTLKGAGANTVLTGSGDDTVTVESLSVTTAYLNEGDDAFKGASATVRQEVYGGAGSDTLTGGSNGDFLDGGAGSDTLYGGAGNDTLIGGGNGLDVLDGGTGDDTYRYFANDGRTTISDSAGIDVLDLSTIASTSVKFLDNSAEYGAGRGFLIESSSVQIFITYGTVIESVKFSDKTLSFSEYSTLMRTRYLSDYDDNYGVGTLGNYRIYGGKGNDFLQGGMLADLIDGGDDSDTVRAGEGDDEVWGGSASAGFDMLYGEKGNDRIYGQAQLTQAFGGDGNDTLVVRSGRGDFRGDAGNDQLWGGTGNDVLFGGEGSDYIFGGDGGDTLNGDAGDDTIVKYSGTGTLSGGSGRDQLWGGTGSETLNGDDGDDFLHAGAGDNTLNGGTGNDSLVSLGGADTLKGGLGVDTLWAGAGNDVLEGDGTLVTFIDGQGLVRYTSDNSQVDYLYGEAGDDLLVGGIGRNLLVGGEGADTLAAGGVSVSTSGAAFAALATVETADFLWGGKGNDTLYANGGDLLYGEAGNDTLQSLIGTNTLNGGAGDDTLRGGTGSSKLIGGEGNDNLFAGIAGDQLFGGTGADYLVANGADLLKGEADEDVLISLSGNNTLDGGAGNDFLQSSSTGVDHLWGGAGLDTYLLTGSGSYFVHEDSSGGVLDVSSLIGRDRLVAGRLASPDQLYLKFGSGAEITVTGWSTSSMQVKLSGGTQTGANFLALLPGLVTA